jgi:uncharacterized protein YjbJ (UPF0337 family)
MNKLQAKGNLNIAKGKMEKTVGKVLEDPDREEVGQKDELVGRAQKGAGRIEAKVKKALNPRNKDV